MKLIEFLQALILLLETLKKFLLKKRIKKYYVYNPCGNKPKYVHCSLESALKEAERIASLCEALDYQKNIEVLEIVCSIEPSGVPF